MRSEVEEFRVYGILGHKSGPWDARDPRMRRNNEQPQVLRLATLAQDDSFLRSACR
jgi:hypothetical protein